jgi:hypothetical protein
MLNGFKRRLERLEKEHKQQTEPSFVIVFRYVSAPNRTPVEATIATARDFTCRRSEGETLESFEARATQECLARYPHRCQRY